VSSVWRAVTGRYGTVFAVLVLLGAGVWALSTPAVAGRILGEPGYEAAYTSPVYGFLGLPLLALPALVAGLLLPKGFFLWGFAVVLAYVPGNVWLTARTGPEVTFQTSEPGMGQILSLAFVEAMIFLSLALACTAAAGIGAGLRALFWWRKGRLRENLSNAQRP